MGGVDASASSRQPVGSSAAALVMRPSHAAYLTLKRAILLNEIEPNATLTELGLAQSMACSQGTVREALLRLQEDGLVLRSGHRGTRVTPLDSATAAEMIALRRQIETRAALASAGRIDGALIETLRQLRDTMAMHARDGDEFSLIETDIRFHLALFGAAGFQAMEPILMRIMLHTHRQKLWEPRHRRPLTETAARHDDILHAIASGGDALAEALGRHIDTIVDVPGEAQTASGEGN